MNLRFKYDYCKEKREQLTTTINCSLHDKYKELSEKCGQPKSKILDVLLMELFDKNEAELNEFIQKVKLY